jgi:tetratricopeptide (TPR) repeat protein
VGLVAHHVEAGGDRSRAAALYGRATKQALAHGALEAALDLARRGLSCGAAGELRAELLVEQAQLCASMGRLDESVPSADEGGTLSERGTDLWGAAQRVLGASLIELGRSSDGEARLSWALRPDVGAGLSPASRSSLLASRVRGLIDLGRLPEALDASSEAVRLAESSDPSTLVRALDARLFALLHAGDPSGVLESGSRLVSAADKAGDVWNGTRARINVASSLNAVGAYEEARTMLEHALLDARARRMRILEAFCLHNLGMSHARLGSLDEGIDHQRGAALVADETNAARLRVHTRTYEAMFLTLRGNPGDYAAARDLAHTCASLTRTIPSLAHIPSFLMARVHLLKRSPAEALPSAEAAHAQLALGPVEEWEEYIRLTHVQVLDALGRTGQAAAAIGAAFDALVAKALRIQQRRYRASFLTRHDEVRALIELAQARVSRVLPPM